MSKKDTTIFYVEDLDIDSLEALVTGKCTSIIQDELHIPRLRGMSVATRTSDANGFLNQENAVQEARNIKAIAERRITELLDQADSRAVKFLCLGWAVAGGTVGALAAATIVKFF